MEKYRAILLLLVIGVVILAYGLGTGIATEPSSHHNPHVGNPHPDSHTGNPHDTGPCDTGNPHANPHDPGSCKK